VERKSAVALIPVRDATDRAAWLACWSAAGAGAEGPIHVLPMVDCVNTPSQSHYHARVKKHKQTTGVTAAACERGVCTANT
jgi:hypothetical protein